MGKLGSETVMSNDMLEACEVASVDTKDWQCVIGMKSLHCMV